MTYGILIITVVYLIIIGLFAYGFDKVKTFYLTETPVKTKFSIIIPFRNESAHLPTLLESIARFTYPKAYFEIIMVDDDSVDNSVDIIKKFQISSNIPIKIIQNKRISHSPKKDAITTAIGEANFDWIITTDADCILPKYWLESFDAFIQHNICKCIVAPVRLQPKHSFLSKFQVLDILSLQGVTIGGFGIGQPFLSNGANLAYKKSLFMKVSGFDGNNNIASGDDIFLLEKALKHFPNMVKYLKCDKAIVTTFPEISWKMFASQRIRWASKTKNYNSIIGKITGLIVLLMNGTLIVTILLTLVGLFKVNTLLYIIVIKFNIDFYLLFKSALFFDQKDILKSYFLSFFIYPFISTYIATASLFPTFKWKGRTFKA